MVEIILDNVSLDYPVYGYHSKSMRNKILSLATAGKISQNHSQTKIRCIDKLSLHLQAGDKLALIGGNGAGKTSLLKMITGIYRPTHGKRMVKGRITSILGTGFGLDEEASGYQNILLGGISLGYTLKEMRAQFKDIEEFTELGQFLNMPLRTYSSGMRARLAFAIATCMKPDILIIDEGIGTGDASFVEKAQKRLHNFLSNASILIIASHSDALLRSFCDKALYLKNGTKQFLGGLEEGLKHYEMDYAPA